MAPLRIKFEWDDKKAASNLRKHGVTFRTASAVFYDNNRIEYPDHSVDHEERWRTLGLTRGAILLLVISTIRHNGIETIRIISARHATAREEEEYYGNC